MSLASTDNGGSTGDGPAHRAPASGEAALLVAVQAAIADRPGALSAARGLSHFGEHSLGWLALAGAGALAAHRRGDTLARRRYLEAGAGAFTAHAASVVIKRVVRRRRPSHPDIRVGVGTPSRLSFPSSHATSTTAGAILLGRAAGLPVAALPAVLVPPMLVSRLVLGVHYPSDVAAGAIVGALTAGAVIVADAKNEEQ
ncbi:phosphatase PAP2 family protein [Gordonia sp. (in: high G+C Gram-positive bacteria)]|uniref:phosphatase PAP2 family protein n=1 Tax=Gordonia sp. (in: high G+C Gram-positive bacteria) TaxID=84139 RepID=UPI003F9AA867